MKLAGGLLLLLGAGPPGSVAPAPSDQAIYAVLEHFARQPPDGSRDCVRARLDRDLGVLRRKERKGWAGWSTPADEYLAAAPARALDRRLLAARPPRQPIARITAVPKPMTLTAENEPMTGPCAFEGNEVEVWHFSVSRPTFSGNWAFVEVGAFALGKYPPPHLWAVEFRQGRWRTRYKARRIHWYD